MRPKKFKDNIVILKFATHKFPKFKEVIGKNWIYYGEKNDYPQYLLDLYYSSSKHNAIVNGKCKYVAGNGLDIHGNKDVNPEKETLNSFVKKIILDKEIFNGIAIEVIWKNKGTAEFRHVDFSKVRSNKDNTQFYFTKKWFTQHGSMNHAPENNDDWDVYEPFNPEKRRGKQLIYWKNYSPGIETYPLPEYKAALLYIELEYQIANYWFNRVKNGFMPSAILNFYLGQPTDNEMKKLEEKIGEKFGGTDNAGQFIINFAPNKEAAADVQQLNPPELGDEYQALNTTLQTEIFTGHGVTNGMLFGIKESGQLGGRTELIEANELFQNRYVAPVQVQFEEFLNENILPYLNLKGETKFIRQEPIGMLDSKTIISTFTPDELRAKAGGKEKKLEGSDKLLFVLNTINQTLADKIIESLSVNELRTLIKFPPVTEPGEQQQFSKHEDISPCVKKLIEEEGKTQEQAVAICISKRERGVLEALKKKGKKRNIKEILYRKPVTYEMSRNLKQSEEVIRLEFAKKKIPVIIGQPVITPRIPEIKTPTEIISVVYAYDWLSGFSDDDLATSRNFCIDLRAETKAGMRWKREDIDEISTAGYEDTWPGKPDIWEMRGGWWFDKSRGIAVPHCRHQWVQEVIREII